MRQHALFFFLNLNTSQFHFHTFPWHSGDSTHFSPTQFYRSMQLLTRVHWKLGWGAPLLITESDHPELETGSITGFITRCWSLSAAYILYYLPAETKWILWNKSKDDCLSVKWSIDMAYWMNASDILTN